METLKFALVIPTVGAGAGVFKYYLLLHHRLRAASSISSISIMLVSLGSHSVHKVQGGDMSELL